MRRLEEEAAEGLHVLAEELPVLRAKLAARQLDDGPASVASGTPTSGGPRNQR